MVAARQTDTNRSQHRVMPLPSYSTAVPSFPLINSFVSRHKQSKDVLTEMGLKLRERTKRAEIGGRIRTFLGPRPSLTAPVEATDPFADCL
jgi:hypothetical protein